MVIDWVWQCRCSTQRERDTCAIRSGSGGRTGGSPAPTPNVLEEANAAIERGTAYGTVTDDFDRITAAAEALGLERGNPLHHPLYMILLKISRLVGAPEHRDSIVDLAGYARTYEMYLDGN